MDIRFDGKNALVTGAGKGIGRLIATRLAEAGAKVLAISRTQSDLDSLQKVNTKIHTLCLDIGKWEKAKEAIKTVGPIDILVNNAGIMEPKELGDLSEEEVDRTLDTNVKSIINITQIIAKGMISRGKGGAIVNMSSCLGNYVAPHCSVYCGSKGAVNQLTRAMAAEYGPHKIRVNSVNPTVTRTRMTEKDGYFDAGNEHANAMKNRTPLRRFAEPSEIVGPVLFLLSDHASMVTGINMPVDGGLSACYV